MTEVNMCQERNARPGEKSSLEEREKNKQGRDERKTQRERERE